MRSDAGLDHTPVKCLLVDDLEENLLALSALLRQDGVEVLQASSGAQALELLLAHDVALALVDVQMPEMDGFELAELMRGAERTRSVPIIFITAGVHDQHRLFKGYERGAVDFLYKPVEPRILKNKAGVFFQLQRQKLQLAQELRERTETLRLNEMFTAVLGHDLRNPLSAILNSGYLMQRSADPRAQALAAQILSSGGRMQRMINELLDLTRIRLAGGIAVNRASTDLGPLLQRLVQEHQKAAPQRRIELIQDGDTQGQWDGDRLAQAASNLIDNAVSHGGADAPVQVRLDGLDPDAVTLTVANSGVIPPQLLPHIFDPFRGRDQHGIRSGLGLGLFIARQIARAHQGEVKLLQSENGQTLFQMIVPRAERPAPDGGRDPRSSSGERSLVGLS